MRCAKTTGHRQALGQQKQQFGGRNSEKCQPDTKTEKLVGLLEVL